MRIGKNLIRYRFAKGMSQEGIAREIGMSQGNYSKIESDKQDASQEQIEALASVLDVSPAALVAPEGPFYNIENQHGGHANNYFVQHGAEAIIAAKEETIGVLKERLQMLEEDNRDLRGQLQKLMNKILGA
jgi:transcriptional regulator with XRE-family HTH domain